MPKCFSDCPLTSGEDPVRDLVGFINKEIRLPLPLVIVGYRWPQQGIATFFEGKGKLTWLFSAQRRRISAPCQLALHGKQKAEARHCGNRRLPISTTNWISSLCKQWPSLYQPIENFLLKSDWLENWKPLNCQINLIMIQINYQCLVPWNSPVIKRLSLKCLRIHPL
jgi:hypothetical protein